MDRNWATRCVRCNAYFGVAIQSTAKTPA
jgi:hypothetical protein